MSDMRRARVEAVLAELGGDYFVDLVAVEVDDCRYLLVEKNVRGNEPPYWLSVHSSPADAGLYQVGQEYAEDWDPMFLVDLDTGDRFLPLPCLYWHPVVPKVMA